MLHIFFDTSALIKRYTPEIGSELIDNVFQQIAFEQVSCSMLGVTEIVSVLVRKHNGKRLADGAYHQALLNLHAEIISSIQIRKVSAPDALIIASNPFIHAHNINATDAIILRSALDLQRALVDAGDTLLFCAADRRLLRAAEGEGLPVLNPEDATEADVQQLLSGAP